MLYIGNAIEKLKSVPQKSSWLLQLKTNVIIKTFRKLHDTRYTTRSTLRLFAGKVVSPHTCQQYISLQRQRRGNLSRRILDFIIKTTAAKCRKSRWLSKTLCCSAGNRVARDLRADCRFRATKLNAEHPVWRERSVIVLHFAWKLIAQTRTRPTRLWGRYRLIVCIIRHLKRQTVQKVGVGSRT